jgi:hypothetical protein
VPYFDPTNEYDPVRLAMLAAHDRAAAAYRPAASPVLPSRAAPDATVPGWAPPRPAAPPGTQMLWSAHDGRWQPTLDVTSDGQPVIPDHERAAMAMQGPPAPPTAADPDPARNALLQALASARTPNPAGDIRTIRGDGGVGVASGMGQGMASNYHKALMADRLVGQLSAYDAQRDQAKGALMQGQSQADRVAMARDPEFQHQQLLMGLLQSGQAPPEVIQEATRKAGLWPTADAVSQLPPEARGRLQANPKTGAPAGTPGEVVADYRDRGIKVAPDALRNALLQQFGQKAIDQSTRSYTQGFDQPDYTPGGLAARFHAGWDILTGNVQAREDEAARLREALGQGPANPPQFRFDASQFVHPSIRRVWDGLLGR